MRRSKKERKDLEGYAFVGPLLLCLGVGMYYGRPDVGALIGVGAGFITALVLKLKVR